MLISHNFTYETVFNTTTTCTHMFTSREQNAELNHNTKTTNKLFKMWQSVSVTTITDENCMHEEINSKLNSEAKNVCLPFAVYE
jgi:hypothetical protein